MSNPIMRYFQYEHLPEGPLRQTSKMFSDLADILDANLPSGAETATALRKLLEAKDAAVRSALDLHKDAVLVFPGAEMPVIHHAAGGVLTYFQPVEPDRVMLEHGDVWFPVSDEDGRAAGDPKIWNARRQDWDPAPKETK